MQIKPKKSLGQNFLIDKNIQNKIIAACRLSGQDTVLEIGSGRGDLTGLIAQKVRQVYALEVDRRLYPQLAQSLKSYGNCRIIKADILKFDLEQFVGEHKINLPLKVVGNIPYYISSPIIEHLIKYRQRIAIAFLTVQKEFARRLLSPPGSKEYGSFSCFVQYYCDCRLIFEIKRNSFKPSPRVDSAFLSLEFRDQPAVPVKDEKGFFRLIRAAFNQRRKTMRNSLEGVADQEKLQDFFRKSGLDENLRPEQFSLAEFARLSDFLNA